MPNIILTSFPFLSWRKESKSFACDASDLNANGFEPKMIKKYDSGKFVFIWEFEIENPKTRNSMKFSMNTSCRVDVKNLYTVDSSGQGKYFDSEGELMFEVFVGENPELKLVVFND